MAGEKFASQQSNVAETELQARQSSMASPSQLANDEEVVHVTESRQESKALRNEQSPEVKSSMVSRTNSSVPRKSSVAAKEAPQASGQMDITLRN